MATNKDKILRAASELIHRNGYEKTSVEMLLSESEVSKSNFYYHFDSKEALCLKVINLWIDDYEKRIFHDILSNSSLTPSERIKSLYDNHKAMLRNFEGIFGCPFGNLAVETSRSGDSFSFQRVEDDNHRMYIHRYTMRRIQERPGSEVDRRSNIMPP